MTDGTNVSGPQNEEPKTDSAIRTPASSDEPFPCPACGQMLAPSCRVCVACKRPIDPAEIKIAPPLGAQIEAAKAHWASARVPFPWALFFVLVSVRFAAGAFAERRWGLLKVELVLACLEMLCAIWVFYDSTRTGVPRPLRWALGSLLLWPIVFPWYLVRRRAPRAQCPFVEGIAMPIVILALLAIGMLIVLIKGPVR